jgi:hypothetical protein
VTPLLAGALAGATLLFWAAATGPAFAQQLPDVYPDAVPLMPTAPAAGPVPDVAPAAGQNPAPGPRERCQVGPVAGPLPGVDPRGLSGLDPNPLVGQRWFVDPREPAVPLMVVMRHQGKECSPTSTAGGAAEDAATREWYDRFADGVGNARVVIGFEPDSLGTLDCLARYHRRARLDVLRYGVDRLSQLPNATIYLDAGASDWEPARRTAKQLRRPPPGGRLHVGQPAGLLGGLLQRRAAPGRNVVAGACPDVRPEPDLVARSASRNGAWALPPIAQFARRPESDRPVTHSSRRVGE